MPTLLEAGLEIKNQESRDSRRQQHVLKRQQHNTLDTDRDALRVY